MDALLKVELDVFRVYSGHDNLSAAVAQEGTLICYNDQDSISSFANWYSARQVDRLLGQLVIVLVESLGELQGARPSRESKAASLDMKVDLFHTRRKNTTPILPTYRPLFAATFRQSFSVRVFEQDREAETSPNHELN